MTESTYPEPVRLEPGWAADTVAVQAGRPARVPGAAMNAPITMSSTYVHDATVEYGRDGNAGWGALEAALGALDGGEAVAFASGLAAATAIADLVPAGGIVVLSTVTYYGVRNILERLQAAGRLELRMAPADDTAAVLAAADGADLVWVESIANPLMVVADVPAIAAGARERGAMTVVDATFATPLRQRPLVLGADIVLHSATKMIGGHSDLLLGAAICRDGAHADVLTTYRHDHGSIPGSLEAFLALRGLRTLAVRLDRAEASAAELARRLLAHPNVSTVHYPGLPGDPEHERASRVLPDGSGSMLSFEVAGSVEQTEAVPGGVAAGDPRDQPRGRGVADRASRALRRRRLHRRPDPLPLVGRHRERRGPLGRPRRGAGSGLRLTRWSAGGGVVRQVPVLHLPGVVEHVVCRVAEQVRDRPVAERLALRVPGAHRLDEAVAVMGEPARRQQVLQLGLAPSRASRSRHPRSPGHAERSGRGSGRRPGHPAGAPPRRGRPSRRTRPTPRAAAAPGGRRSARRTARGRAARARTRCPRSRSSRPPGTGR